MKFTMVWFDNLQLLPDILLSRKLFASLQTVKMKTLLSGLPTLCLKKVWKLREVLNVLVTTSMGLLRHRRCQRRKGALSNFWNYSRVLAGCFVVECEKVIVFGIYYKKKSRGKVCSIKNSLRSQTKVWKLATLVVVCFYRTETLLEG